MEYLNKLMELIPELKWEYDTLSGYKKAKAIFKEKFEIKVGNGYSSCPCNYVDIRSIATDRIIKTYTSWAGNLKKVDDFYNKVFDMIEKSDKSQEKDFEELF